MQAEKNIKSQRANVEKLLVFLSLSYFFSHQLQGASTEQQYREEESYGIGHPYSPDTHVAREAKEISRRNSDEEVCNEWHPHDNLHIGKSTQSVGKDNLRTVEELIEDEYRE